MLQGGIKYEVKADFKAYMTGNFAIEHTAYGKPSGISITTSDYYAIYVVGDDYYTLYIIPVHIIKAEIMNRRSYRGGDGGLSEMYLVSVKKFKEYKWNPYIKISSNGS